MKHVIKRAIKQAQYKTQEKTTILLLVAKTNVIVHQILLFAVVPFLLSSCASLSPNYEKPAIQMPAKWYSQDKSRGGQGFVGNMVNKIVSGYPAVSDNNNIYIDALNYNKSAESLYSNIYLFSINTFMYWIWHE